MSTVPFVKQQDFCLRLGLLRALLAVLPSHDRSIDREPILEKLRTLLFAPLRTCSALEDEATELLGERPRPPGSSRREATVADGLLLTSDAKSWGQPVDAIHVAKILDWGHAAGLLGRGNQITERGRLLRGYFDRDAVAQFLRKDPRAWNPFSMSRCEKTLWFYHLGELDELLWRSAFAVGLEGEGGVVEVGRAHEIVATSMTTLVDRCTKAASMADVPRLRVLRELAKTIESEVGGKAGVVPLQRRRVGPPRPGRARSKSTRATTKNADHQTIPRFETLVDLGFLEKRVDPSVTGQKRWVGMNAWTFVVTPAARLFASAMATAVPERFQWEGFGHAVASAFYPGSTRSPPVDIVDILFDAYERVERRAGHTPFESLAMITLVEALSQGKYFEIGGLHEAFLRAKAAGALEGHVFFAARNEVDRMMIAMKSSAREPLRAFLAML